MRKIIYNSDKVSADDGVFFGRGVFETILCKDVPIFLDEHIDRLRKSMDKIGLVPLEETTLKEYLSKLNIMDKALKITVTPSNIIITQREINYKKEHYDRGMSLTISKVRRNSTSILSYIKSTCYIENLIEKEKAKKIGYDDVIFLNEKGYVAETSCANLFILCNKEIFTPKIEDGLLDGIIRRRIIENCSVNEKSITVQDLKEAEEVIITNSLMEIMPIRKIDEVEYDSQNLKSRLMKILRF
ncbi:aminotransferase class IV [Clostridium saccharobutylicum]|uniref:Aminodeoxychorismate lyase n=1 Tax=Clostridium saccharobutylicum TaxID=169679 RepID=A0A1S8MRB4_CLOSA|nr:aminotransferase class IV [Clostridium saccharobutylicum]OOM06729.1 aminodeoxychorismate lyase [Clostridium saccharobutylicum]